MAVNLLEAGTFYYHPLTRKKLRPRALIPWPDGVLIEEAPEPFKISFRDSLSDEEIVRSFYARIGLETVLHNLARDAGAVRFMVKQGGLDVSLFAIDCLVDDYLEAETRSYSPPEIIGAGEFTQDAITRMGTSKQVAMQYGIGESSWNPNAVNR